MKINRRAAWTWIGIHVGALVAVLLFPLYRRLTRFLAVFLSSCILHDRLHLYCPLCGGTRAIEAILRFDLAAAFSYNPFVFLLLIGLNHIAPQMMEIFFNSAFGIISLAAVIVLVICGFLAIKKITTIEV